MDDTTHQLQRSTDEPAGPQPTATSETTRTPEPPTPAPTAVAKSPKDRLLEATKHEPWAIGYLVFFAASAIALLTFARSGASTLVVQGLIILFVVAATLWVRGQYIDALDDSPWVLPGDVTTGMLIVAAALGVTWILTERAGLGLFALFVFWVAGSAIVSRMRGTAPSHPTRPHRKFFAWSNAHHRSIGAVAALAGSALILAGVSLLGRGSQALLVAAAIMLFLGLVILLPIGISLLSEVAISRLQSGGDQTNPAKTRRLPLSTVLWLAGLVGLVIVSVVVAQLAHTRLVYVVVAALFVIVVAVASSTHADAALVMAAVALLGVTPQQQSLPDLLTVTAPAGSAGLSTFVALGDSYMSGEGASVYYKGTDDGGGNQCRRAPTAWAALASGDGYQAFEFLACSGAETGNVLYDPRAAKPETAIPAEAGARALSQQLSDKGIIETQDGDTGTQLDHWRADQQQRGLVPTIVVVSLGGNDAGFSTIGTMCLAPGSCETKKDLWIGSLEQVRTQLRLAYAEISETFPSTPVVTVGYPDPIAEVDPCDQVSLTQPERAFIHEFLTGNGTQDGLNDVIAKTSAEYGFYYVSGTESALARAHLQLCDPLNDGRPGLNFIGLRSVRGAAEQRFNPANWIHSSLHPNERGHAALLQAFQTWRASQPTPLPARVPGSTVAASQRRSSDSEWSRNTSETAQKTVDNAGQCDLFESSASGCRTQGSDWTQQQVRHMLLTRGLWVCLAVGALAWLFAVGFFADRRRGWLEYQKQRRTQHAEGGQDPADAPVSPPRE